ncbi:CAP domain-containing protein [Lutibacter sp. A80]|uniref:CAP domain-containing protein n=1 Tax=Lutibacter sp. A80 TaxID=2918453 RepID=UPI001F0524FD|nr:CAP domain-containing protein [Lutibacter sp. A80]UMB60081.1 CAP domain-containing protein [Lutibacter sp. A80]
MKPLYAILILSLSLLCSCSSADEDVNLFETNSKVEETATTVAYSEMETEILDLINEYREENNLSTLKVLNIISTEADTHTTFMITNGEVSHANFNVRAENLITNAGAKFVSENVAYGYSTAKAVVNGWLNSTEHRKNIENPDTTHFGISTKSDDNGRNYFTHIFIKK